MKSVIICDMEGIIQEMNKDALNLFGYSKDELIEKKESQFFLLVKLLFKTSLDG